MDTHGYKDTYTNPDTQTHTQTLIYSHIVAHDTSSSRPAKRPPFDQPIIPSVRQNTKCFVVLLSHRLYQTIRYILPGTANSVLLKTSKENYVREVRGEGQNGGRKEL